MSRRLLIGAWTGLPACVVAVVGVWSFVGNNAGGWTWAPDTVTLPEAIATGNYSEVAYQLERGVDPNAAADVRPDILGSAPMHMTPLQAAVSSRNSRMVQMLLEHAVVTPQTLAMLKCLNDENGNQEVRALLDALPADTTPSCDEVSIPR